MFQEIERSYRTALEDELTSNVKILKILLIVLLVSSGSLLLFFVLHLIFSYEPFYAYQYYDGKLSSAFSNIFLGISNVLQYPALLILAIILIKIAKNLVIEIKKKLNIAAYLIFGIVGLNLIFTLVAGIFYVFNNPMSEGYTKFLSVQFTFTFYTDYLMISIAVILISLILLEMKNKQEYTRNITITPFIQGGFFTIWLLCVLAYRITGFGLLDGLVLTINLLSCLFAVSMIATYIEFLIRMDQINVPQIIAMTEKLP